MRKLNTDYKVGDKLYAKGICSHNYYVYTIKEVLKDRYIVFNDLDSRGEVAEDGIDKEMTEKLNSEKGKRIQKYNKAVRNKIEKEREEKEMKKPKAEMIGKDGNVFNLIAIARKSLKRAGMLDKANEMTDRVQEADSYDEALQIMMEYVDIV